MTFSELEPTVMSNSFVSLEPIKMEADPFRVLGPVAFLQGPSTLTDEQFAAAYGKYQLMYPPEATSYSFTQTSPSTRWVIPHTLTFAPSVTITDLTGAVVITEIVFVSPTLIHSISMYPFAGYAHLS